ncbi:hypothetical protein SmJEL517_g02388 [Synchytrium microbalum]|uniref:Uncharacterized protein n=1 Tax=Synchytrium microbalum TaxID=1806994 RepID=A0A507CC59_9FUNG|nr:uncharacterized protein SmJEL517_g02388 [Synchytrium microbalum]TPX35133.1 hypothetical protein SmJEL517_g02388 [Synchytrium microbalum]
MSRVRKDDSDDEEWNVDKQASSAKRLKGRSSRTTELTDRESLVASITEVAGTLRLGDPQNQPKLLQNVTLRNYQAWPYYLFLEGVRWLASIYRSNVNGLLADEMGLGKTIQAIGLIAHLHETSIKRHLTLVIVPVSVLDNWADELSRWAPALKFISHHGTRPERDALRSQITNDVNVIVTTPETFNADVEYFGTLSLHLVIVDEAHRLKNRSSLFYQNLEALDIPHSVLLSGTPIQNNLYELYAMLRFSNPQIWGDQVDRFLEWFDPGRVSADEKQERMDQLKELLKPFMLRRNKKDVLTLPELTETVIYTPLTKIQRAQYKSLLSKDPTLFDKTQRSKLLNVLSQLRKCVNHPYMFSGVEPEPYEAGEHLVDASGKLVIVDRLLSELKKRDRRALIFSQSTHMLDVLQDYLTYREYSYERLDGSVRGEERNLAVKTFSKATTFVFLLSTRAGGVGLNLTAADTVIFIDSDWNPTMDQQAMARAHRIGQTKTVQVFRLLARDTVEEIIYRRATKKLALSRDIMKGVETSVPDESSSAPNGTDELVSMLQFGLKKVMSDEELEDDMTIQQISDLLDGKSIDDAAIQTLLEVSEDENSPENFYMYEGHDYKADQVAFEKLKEDAFKKEFTVSKRKRSPAENDEEFSAQDEADRVRRKAENAAKKHERKLTKWAENGYESRSLEVVSKQDQNVPDGDVVDDEGDDGRLSFVSGDVSRPHVNDGRQAIIIHVCDDSGYWPGKGVFAALSSLGNCSEYYEAASENDDLLQGSAHLIESSKQPNIHVALAVAQKRSRDNSISPIRFPDLEQALNSIAKAAKSLHASIHLPRLGQTTPGFDWYKTERLIRKCLVNQGLPVSIYYYQRGGRGSSRPHPRTFKAYDDDDVVMVDEASSSSRHQPNTDTSPSESGSDTELEDELENDVSSKYIKQPDSHRTNSTNSTNSVFTVPNPFLDVLEGCIIHLVGISSPDLERQFARRVIAYGGEISMQVSEHVTHLVCGHDEAAVSNLLEHANLGPETQIVPLDWLVDMLVPAK